MIRQRGQFSYSEWSERWRDEHTMSVIIKSTVLFPRGEQNVNLPKVSPRNLPLMIYRPRLRQSCRRSFPFLFTVWSWLFLWIWENVLFITVSLLLMYLLPCVSGKSGCSPVLAFRSRRWARFPGPRSGSSLPLMWRTCLRCSRGTLMAGCIWHIFHVYGIYLFWMRAVPCGF